MRCSTGLSGARRCAGLAHRAHIYIDTTVVVIGVKGIGFGRHHGYFSRRSAASHVTNSHQNTSSQSLRRWLSSLNYYMPSSRYGFQTLVAALSQKNSVCQHTPHVSLAARPRHHKMCPLSTFQNTTLQAALSHTTWYVNGSSFIPLLSCVLVQGLLLFIDEADAFMGQRGDTMSEGMRGALNAILFRTGDQSRDFAVVLATNRPGAPFRNKRAQKYRTPGSDLQGRAASRLFSLVLMYT